MSASENHDVARLRQALASLADTERGEGVDVERIFDAVSGKLSAEERRAVVEELVRNPDAAEVWRLARELMPAEHADIVPTRALWKWTSLAAAGLLAIGLGWQFFGTGRPAEEPVYRGVEQRSIASTLPADAPLSRENALLRWTAVERARYRVRVLTPDLEVLEEADDLETPEYTLSTDVLQRIPPGGQILWQVEASIPGRGRLISPTFSARVE